MICYQKKSLTYSFQTHSLINRFLAFMINSWQSFQFTSLENIPVYCITKLCTIELSSNRTIALGEGLIFLFDISLTTFTTIKLSTFHTLILQKISYYSKTFYITYFYTIMIFYFLLIHKIIKY